MMTAKQYEESLRKLNLEVYMFGNRLEPVVDNPIVRPSMNAVAKTYELAHYPEYEPIMTATSHITGKKINRFTHIHQNIEDLVKKSKMGRLLGRETGCCFQRCVGMDALNALSIITYNIDEKYKTDYYDRFLHYLKYVQEADLTCDGAMTDPKGDRSLPPHKQKDPDLYLHVVEETDDGIVVRGAKAHQTGAVNSHEIIVMPTLSLREKDKEYAVSFALPSDSTGITYIIGHQSCDTRKLEGGRDQGNLFYGGHEAVVIFDDVVVPWERVFMYKEYEFAGQLVEKFASYHRQSYACKVGVGDVVIGAAQTIAEYNGVEKTSHIKDKICEMNHLNETLYCGCIACASEGHREPSGTYAVDMLLANVHKHNVTRFPYEIARIAQDIAGGLMVTMPSEKDFESPRTGKWLKKYFRGVGSSTSTEDRMRILRLIENLTVGSAAVSYLTESLHGAGSPQAQRIMISRLVDMGEKQKAAKNLCGIEP
jgi:4-hydroxybutyryl-CoA dehydratase/vinylacetyl-CoA-Delta-isomerase